MTEAPRMRTQDFFIIGPAMQPDNGVLEAIYSLLYLPLNYKLMLPTVAPENTTFREEVTTAIEKNALQERVHFVYPGNSTGSPEAFASAALKLSRTAH
jgi:hypothetical protein